MRGGVGGAAIARHRRGGFGVVHRKSLTDGADARRGSRAAPAGVLATRNAPAAASALGRRAPAAEHDAAGVQLFEQRRALFDEGGAGRSRRLPARALPAARGRSAPAPRRGAAAAGTPSGLNSEKRTLPPVGCARAQQQQRRRVGRQRRRVAGAEPVHRPAVGERPGQRRQHRHAVEQRRRRGRRSVAPTVRVDAPRASEICSASSTHS